MVTTRLMIYSRALKAFRLIRLKFWRSFLGMHEEASLHKLHVVYKSDNYIVVNKHYDVKVNSDDESDKVTVAKQLAQKFPELVDAHISHKFRFVHRLDYSTSGAVAVALNRRSAADAQIKFRDRLVTKEYLALVRGHVEKDHRIISMPISPETKDGYTHMMKTAKEGDNETKTQTALTELSVIQHGFYDGDPVTKIKLIPFTGRRHQLRVHCNSIGHTVVGDYTYSGRKDVKPYRMMLHSYKLAIPAETEQIDVCTSDPFVSEVDPKWVPFIKMNKQIRK